MSGYVNPVFRPDFTDYPAPPQNRLASGFNAIWPASNPVGTETTQGMQSATPTDQIAFMRPDGTPVMASDMARAHQQVQQAMQTAPTMALGMVGDAPGIRAFHGSPYDFERFDTSKIGTGEGAQAYGHGLYFAEGEGVARSYRDRLSAGQEFYHDGQKLSGIDDIAAGLVHGTGGNKEAALKQASFLFGDIESNPYTKGLSDSIAKLDPSKITAQSPPGKMYEVNIGADPEQFLHWDRPLSEQSPQVQQAAAKAWDTGNWGHPLPDDLQGATGQEFHNRLAQKILAENYHGNMPPPSYSAPGASAEALQQAGIPGIRYLDQGSRGAGEGTHNYVVFDANTIDILRKYGLAGLGIGLGGAVAGTQPQSQ